MTNESTTPAPVTQVIDWAGAEPVFADRLRAPKSAAKPSDGAIKMAQRSYDGETHGDTIVHVLRFRFPTAEIAEAAAGELKRAGTFTVPESSVRVVIDPDNTGDQRMVAWSAGSRRGRAKT